MIPTIPKHLFILLLAITSLLQLSCQNTDAPPPPTPSLTPTSTLTPTATPVPTLTPTVVAEERIEGVDLCTQMGCNDSLDIQFSRPLEAYTLELVESPTKTTVFWCDQTEERNSRIPSGNVEYFSDRTQVKNPSRWEGEIPESWPALALCDELPLFYGTAEWDPATAMSDTPVIWHARAFCGEPIETEYEGYLPKQWCEDQEVTISWSARKMPEQFDILLHTEFGTVELGKLPEIEPYFPNGEQCDQDYFCRSTEIQARIPTAVPDASE